MRFFICEAVRANGSRFPSSKWSKSINYVSLMILNSFQEGFQSELQKLNVEWFFASCA